MSDLASPGSAARPLRQRLERALVDLRWYDQALAVSFIVFVAILGDSEPDWYYFVPSFLAFMVAWSAAFVFSARWRLSYLIAVGLVLTIYAISWAKYSIVAMKFHVYDIVFHALSLTQFLFWFSTFTSAAAMTTSLVAIAFAGLTLVWRLEEPSAVRIGPRAAGSVIAALLCFGSAKALFDRHADFFTSRHFYISSFIFSFGDLPSLLQFGGLMEASAEETPALQRGAGVLSCSSEGARPHIVLFLNESTMPPGVYPGISFPDETKPLFTSFDGRQRRLRVETFGGATWLSDFSALTGLSTWSFGSLRNFVAQFMTGRLRHSLPAYLKACGYETTMIYPSRADFAGSDEFYKSIGFDRIIDRAAHKAPDERQRDSFYWGLVLDQLRVGKTSGRPQFIVASSMASHSPWDFRYAPEELGDGQSANWNGDRQLDEYLWRLVVAERDRKEFRAQAMKLLPTAPVLFVSYGDHQPALRKIPLRDAIGIADAGRSDSLQPSSIGFETYYAIDAQNFTPRLPADEPAILEIPYLPSMIVAAAGLPRDEVFERREQLRELCRGLYHTCPYRQHVLKFHRWLADSGWLQTR
ncbi:MAG: sulfatase-like hydrolase/transferase [Beijerinckiaceae bacterium]